MANYYRSSIVIQQKVPHGTMINNLVSDVYSHVHLASVNKKNTKYSMTSSIRNGRSATQNEDGGSAYLSLVSIELFIFSQFL